MKTIQERLREWARGWYREPADAAREAADEIDWLYARVAELEARACKNPCDKCDGCAAADDAMRAADKALKAAQ